jgi:hypothetical protein
VRLGGAHPSGAQLATARSATAISPSRARCGCAGSSREAAQRAKTQPPFAHTYAQIAHRRGRQIATVAIARKLLARCFHILTELEEPTTKKATTGRARITA